MPLNCPKGYGICWTCEWHCDSPVPPPQNSQDITRALHIYPTTIEHHEARAQWKRDNPTKRRP